MKYYVTKARREDYVPTKYDSWGIAWDGISPHPGFQCFEDNEMIEENLDKVKAAYEKASAKNPDLSFEDFKEMMGKQAKAKADKKKSKENKKVKEEPKEKPVVAKEKKETKKPKKKTSERVESKKLTDEEKQKIREEIHQGGERFATKLNRMNAFWKNEKRREYFLKPMDDNSSIDLYKEIKNFEDGPDAIIKPLLAAIKQFSGKQWGPFASEVEVTKEPEGDKEEVYILEFDWEYGHERVEFSSLKEAKEYPSFIQEFYSKVSFDEKSFVISKEIRYKIKNLEAEKAKIDG